MYDKIIKLHIKVPIQNRKTNRGIENLPTDNLGWILHLKLLLQCEI